MVVWPSPGDRRLSWVAGGDGGLARFLDAIF
jgi:hypothetical protein